MISDYLDKLYYLNLIIKQHIYKNNILIKLYKDILINYYIFVLLYIYYNKLIYLILNVYENLKNLYYCN